MSRLILSLVFMFGICATAHADIWTWADANGDLHYVDSMRPIYTWIDDDGNVHYADKPGYEGAVRVRLAWHSSGSLSADQKAEDELLNAATNLDETEQQKGAREMAESYYCSQATEVYESYVGAEKLYLTNKKGEREYLSKRQKKEKMAETKAAMDQWCG
jgi:hypothetical protein